MAVSVEIVGERSTQIQSLFPSRPDVLVKNKPLHLLTDSLFRSVRGNGDPTQ